MKKKIDPSEKHAADLVPNKKVRHCFRANNVGLDPLPTRQACFSKARAMGVAFKRVDNAWEEDSKRHCVHCCYLAAKKKNQNKRQGLRANLDVPKVSRTRLGCPVCKECLCDAHFVEYHEYDELRK